MEKLKRKPWQNKVYIEQSSVRKGSPKKGLGSSSSVAPYTTMQTAKLKTVGQESNELECLVF